MATRAVEEDKFRILWKREAMVSRFAFELKRDLDANWESSKLALLMVI